MPAWSPEIRVLGSPAATFREVATASRSGAWTLLRRPLLLLLAMGITLSVLSSNRISVRVVADGMVSFAFLAVIETIALGIVFLREKRALPFARAVDAFFVSNSPFFLWMLAFWVWRFAVTPLQATAWPSARMTVAATSLVIMAVWTVCLDLQFFRVVLPRRSGGALVDLLLQRAIAWTAGLTYFFGIAVWAWLVGRIR